MKTVELREKSNDELQTLLQSSLREKFNLRMQKSTNQMKQWHMLKNLRRLIARIHTLLREREMKAV